MQAFWGKYAAENGIKMKQLAKQKPHFSLLIYRGCLEFDHGSDSDYFLVDAQQSLFSLVILSG